MPSPTKPTEILLYRKIESPIGPLLIARSERGLAVLHFGHELPRNGFCKLVSWQESETALAPVELQLREYFEGKRREFTVPLDLRGTEFQLRCWRALLEIPYGETISYAELSQRVGSLSGFRAVGAANGANPVALIVPCHRVIATGGGLGGYGGGLPAKEYLLRLEQSNVLQRFSLTPG